MKNSLRIIALVMALTAVFTLFAACSKPDADSDPTPEPTVGDTTPSPEPTEEPDEKAMITGMTAEQIIGYVYDNMAETEFSAGFFGTGGEMMNVDIADAETFAYYFGIALDFEEAMASEPPMVPPAFSFCVALLPEGANMEGAKTSVSDNADPMKWICTGADAVRVEIVENVVALIMADEDTVNSIADAFLSLAEPGEYVEPDDGDDGDTSAMIPAGIDEASMMNILNELYLASVGSAHADMHNTGAGMMASAVDADSLHMFTHTEIDFELAVTSCPLRTPDAFVLYIIKVGEDADIDGAMDNLRANADPAWQICVEAEAIEVVNNGNYILYMMGPEEELAIIRDAFLALNIEA